MFWRWLSFKEVLACSELQILLLFLSSFASSCFVVIKKCLEFWSHRSWGISLSRSSTPRQTSPEVKPLKVAIGCQHWCIDPWWNSSTPLQWYADLLNLYVLSRQSTTSFCNLCNSAQFCGVSLRWKSVLSLKAKETWSILLGLGTWTKWSGSLVLTTPWRFATAPLLQSSSLCFGRVCFVVQTYSSAFWGLQFWQGTWPSKARQLKTFTKTFREWI